MPHKYNAGKCQHISKAQFTVTNWPEYEAGLKRRCSLTLWLTPEAIALWKAAARTTPGGQARYSALAIQTCLILRTAFRISIVTRMADLDRERLLKWIIAWCGLSTAWSLSSNDTVSTTIKVAELAMTELEE